MPRPVSGAVLCVVVALAAACASSPPSRFYTLSSTASSGASSGVATSKLSVIVGPVSVPAIVDLPQIVVSTGPNQVTIDEFNRWASPLPNNISRVVAENLVQLLGTPRVSQFQQSLSAEGDYRVAIEVQTFESAPGDAATLNAAWLVRRARDGKSETGRTTVREPAAEKSFDALAAAHSRALSRMSQDIADAVRAARPRAVGPCSSLSSCAPRPRSSSTTSSGIASPARTRGFPPARTKRGGMRPAFRRSQDSPTPSIRISPRSLRFAGATSTSMWEDGRGRRPPAGISMLENSMHQMVWDAVIPEADPAFAAVPLGPQHVPQMLELVELRPPGPFAARTRELGDYYGVIEGGRLVAMAGERMAAGAWREISGVCTHPDVEGRGLAWRLIAKLVRSQMQRGETPFLHVMSDNVHARRLYERMGFRFHQEVAVRVVSRL